MSTNQSNEETAETPVEPSVPAEEEPPSGKPAKKKTASQLPAGKSYTQLVHDAIVALKDKTGSSYIAISKWVLTQYPELEGPHFKARLTQAIKGGVKTKRFIKVRNSFKISTEYKKPKSKSSKAKSSHSDIDAEVAELQKKHAQKLQTIRRRSEPDVVAKAEKDFKKKEDNLRKKLMAQKEAAIKAERIKKRKFPMEDTKLHAEDIELDVKPPDDVVPRPYLPYFWHVTVPVDHASRQGKTSTQVLQASKADALDYGSAGLVSDLLQVYHFFRGDVHFCQENGNSIVPEFTLRNLVMATEQILNGNARKSRMIPPLIVHLFVSCLQILCQPVQYGANAERVMKEDLHKYLYPALSPASWADICFLYMDAMERYYSTDATLDPTVLQPLRVDVPYLLGIREEAVVPLTPFRPGENSLPAGYKAYLGDHQGSLYRAYAKLGNQDPWTMNAEEIMALLRALCDDVLADHPHIAQDIAQREEAMAELKRAKRAADNRLKKVKAAYEGPIRKGKKDGPHQPTATLQQLEDAEAAQVKATEAYELGIQKLVARTEPVGYDRNLNAVYCFRHDPEVLYVEDLGRPSGAASHLPKDIQVHRRTWHVIETASLFDMFASSLDIRGRREHDLYEELMGPEDADLSLRRFLQDDIEEENTAAARLVKRDELREQIVHTAERSEMSRRSGRIGSTIEEDELAKLQRSLELLEKKIRADSEPDIRDYQELTGLDALRKFDTTGGAGIGGPLLTRKGRDRARKPKPRKYPILHCSKLYSSGKVDDTGLMGVIVSQLMEVEQRCESLVSWKPTNGSRADWIAKLRSIVSDWNNYSPVQLSTPMPVRASQRGSDTGDEPTTPARGVTDEADEATAKKPRLESPAPTISSSGPSLPAIVSSLKQPLLDLEARMADLICVVTLERDNELADENISTTDEVQDEEEGLDDEVAKERKQRAWRRPLQQLRSVAVTRPANIRDLIVAAITAARRAHQSEIVPQLRAAILLYDPAKANVAKDAAIKILDDHGGFDPAKDDYDEEESEGGEEVVYEPVLSCVAAEAAVLAGSLTGNAEANRSDWIKAVNECKSMTRLSSLVAGFYTKASAQLVTIEKQHDDLRTALSLWEKEAKRKTGRPADPFEPSEVWAQVEITEEFCMAQGQTYPFWPARKCTPKDKSIAASLATLDRSLVTLAGEMGSLRCVKNEDTKAFTGKMDPKDVVGVRKEYKNHLEDCIALTRRLKRGYDKKPASIAVPMDTTP